MKYEIKHRYTGEVLYSADVSSVRECVGKAVKGGVNLQGVNLQGADLWGANLQGADLRGADLQGADLQCANLQGANLWGANLQDAYLRDADLWGANLRGADLRRADLWGADLWGADLQGAKGILRFNGERHEAIAHMHEGEVYIKIGCEFHKAREWVKIFEAIGADEGYSNEAITRYGMFIELVVKTFGGDDASKVD